MAVQGGGHRCFLSLCAFLMVITTCLSLRIADFELSPTASPFNNPQGVAIDPINETLYVADTGNSRVLIFNYIYTILPGAAPQIVLGQTNLTDTFANRNVSPTRSTLKFPQEVFLNASWNLFVSDTGNNRVLRWDNLATLTPGAPASGWVGQTTQSQSSSGINAGQLNTPIGIFVVDQTLWIADQQNNR